MSNISTENQHLLDKIYRSTIIGLAVQGGLTLILVVLAWLAPMPNRAEAAYSTVTTIWSLILFVALGAFLLRRILYNWEKIKNIGVLRGVAGVLTALRKYAYFLGFLGLTAAILGIVLTYLTGDPWQMTRAGLVALVVFAAGFPRRSVWKKIVANLEKTEETADFQRAAF